MGHRKGSPARGGGGRYPARDSYGELSGDTLEGGSSSSRSSGYRSHSSGTPTKGDSHGPQSYGAGRLSHHKNGQKSQGQSRDDGGYKAGQRHQRPYRIDAREYDLGYEADRSRGQADRPETRRTFKKRSPPHKLHAAESPVDFDNDWEYQIPVATPQPPRKSKESHLKRCQALASSDTRMQARHPARAHARWYLCPWCVTSSDHEPVHILSSPWTFTTLDNVEIGLTLPQRPDMPVWGIGDSSVVLEWNSQEGCEVLPLREAVYAPELQVGESGINVVCLSRLQREGLSVKVETSFGGWLWLVVDERFFLVQERELENREWAWELVICREGHVHGEDGRKQMRPEGQQLYQQQDEWRGQGAYREGGPYRGSGQGSEKGRKRKGRR